MESFWLLGLGYFLSYVGTGIAVKFFTGATAKGFMGMNSMEYLVYSTTFSALFCVSIVILYRWHLRGKLTQKENLLLLLSGICTAYIIPSTTLIFSLPISVMIAMVVMRGSVIIVSRTVDFVLKKEGLQKRTVSWQENAAVVFALMAVATKFIFNTQANGGFSALGVILLAFYVGAYGIRLYIMNRAKLTGICGKKLDQKLFFAREQLFASGALTIVSVFAFVWIHFNPSNLPTSIGAQFHESISQPNAQWLAGSIAGLPYGIVALFSVFLFLFPGKTATFTGVANRLISLLAGTTSTLALYYFFGTSFPPSEDWVAFSLILVAILFLAWGDLKGLRKVNLPLLQEAQTD